MHYFHTDDPRMIEWLANVMRTAAENGTAVRIATGDDNTLKVKVGQGMWTAPFASTPDTYRDA